MVIDHAAIADTLNIDLSQHPGSTFRLKMLEYDIQINHQSH